MKLSEIRERRSMLLDKADSLQADLKTAEHGSERERRLNRGTTKILAEIDGLNEREAVLQAERNVEIQAGLKSGKYTVERGDGFDLDRDPMRDHRDQTPVFTRNDPWSANESGVLGRSVSFDEAKSRALSAVELASGLSEGSREKATGILEDQDLDGIIARYALVTSDPDYVSAFSQMMRDPHPLLTDAEIRAVRRAREFGRAMSLTDSEGGFLVPFQLPAVIQTDDLGVSDIRRISKTVVATGDVWNGVSSGAVSFSWDSEAAEVSDDATVFAQPAITIHMARGFVPISIEALMDEANVTETITSLLVDGRNDLEGTALATGSGSGQPFGIVTALAGTGSELVSATTDVFALEDVNGLWDALPARYQESATWLANGIIYNEIRGFGAAGSPAPFITELKEEQLIKRPMAVSSYMDATYGSGDNYILIVGDFSNYVVASRIGMQVELVPHLFGAGSNRPTGQRGFFAFYREGADSVHDGALAVLNIT